MKGLSGRWLVIVLACVQLLPTLAALEPNQGPNVPAPVTAPNSPVPIPTNVTVPTERELQNDSRTGIPLVDSLRDQAFHAADQTLATLNETLKSHGVSPDLLPSADAIVFNDTAEPGARNSGIGDWAVLGDAGWSAKAHAGWNDSFGFTTTNMVNGTYAHTKSVFVTPAIDLSAYPLQTGTIPYANAGIDLGGTIAPYCDQGVVLSRNGEQDVPNAPQVNAEDCVLVTPDGRALQDLINLAFTMRIDVADGRDGGQVRVFTEKPDNDSIKLDPGDIIKPMQYFGEYGEARAFGTDGGTGPAFTGTHGWTTAVFDLTPYAGRTIWIAFEFVSTAPSVAAPDRTAPQGWFVDNVTVVAPAVAHDLKMWGIDGPTLRLSDRDLYPRVAPGANATFSPVILNAGASNTSAHLHVEIELPYQRPLVTDDERVLAPGEVWTRNVTTMIPDIEGKTINVSATVFAADPLTGQAIDPTANNAATATYRVATVRHVTLALKPATVRVDDNAPETVDAAVTNAGNVVARGDLSGSVSVPAASPDSPEQAAPLSPAPLTLAPGETRIVTWSLPTSVRGQYNVSATFSGGAAAATSTYFVHASPPAIYADGGAGGVDRAGWTWMPVIAEPPNDPYAWKFAAPQGPSPPGPEPALIARPDLCRSLPSTDPAPAMPCLPDEARANEKFGDLRLSIRYASDAPAQASGAVSITYPLPLTAVGDAAASKAADTPSAEETVWTWDLPVGGKSYLDAHLSYNAWTTIEARIQPNNTQLAHATDGMPGLQMSHAQGYADLWSVEGLEVRVTPVGKTFYVDDLKLTGVPVGSQQRVTLLHVTGNAASDANVAGSVPNCVGSSGVESSCWESVEPARREQWPAGYVDNAIPAADPDLFAYGSLTRPIPDGARSTVPELLLSPNITLHDASEPTLVLDHAYFDGAYVAAGVAKIPNIAFVEMQYVRDDGSWSDFVRLVPAGGYPSVLARSINGSLLRADNIDTSGRYLNENGEGADGFYYPAPCAVANKVPPGQRCDQGGYIGETNATNTNIWRPFDSPHEDETVFRLADQAALDGVDLSDRVVRFGFRAPSTDSQLAYWVVHALRVLPFPDFAIDGAVDDAHLETPYDARAIGVGPGTVVPVNVTVSDQGIYPDEFVVTLNVTRPDGTPFPETQVTTGILTPGTSKSITIAWSVPTDEDQNYTLNVSIAPTTNNVHDEAPQNDRITLGADGMLVARSSVSYQLQASVVPKTGPAGFARHFFVTMSNTGNEPIAGIQVTRTISWTTPTGVGQAPLGGPLTMHVQQLPLGAVDLPLTAISDDATFDDLQYTPPEVGSYRLSVVAQTDATSRSTAADFTAVAVLYADAFDHGIDWRTSDPHAWTVVPGPKGAPALAVDGGSPGILPANTNVTIESPPLPLSDARAATLSLLAKYELEPGYDGARAEISLPNGSWAPLDPQDPSGRTGQYSSDKLVGSNALALEQFPRETRAMSGDSHAVLPNTDGWTPYSFDLSQIPELQDGVALDTLRVPNPPAGPLTPIAGETNAFSASWLQTAIGDPFAKWELRNEGRPDHAITDAWWSGVTTPTTDPRQLSSPDLTVVTPDGTDLLKGQDLSLSWWEYRPGASNTTPDGVGAVYNVTFNDSVRGVIATQANASPRALDARDGWRLLQITVPGSAFAHQAGESIHVNFSTWTPNALAYTETPAGPTAGSYAAAATNSGWLVGDVSVEATSLKNGMVTPSQALPVVGGSDAPSLADWTTAGWTRVCTRITTDCTASLPVRSAPWNVVVQPGPDGLPTPMWTLGLTSDPAISDNVDARVVTPAVDLTKSGGADLTLALVHKYDLYSNDQLVPTGTPAWMSKWYRGGVVEAQVLDEGTGTWGPWTQVFAHGATPSAEVSPLADLAKEGAPYTRILGDAGQTFARYPRVFNESVYTTLNDRTNTVESNYIKEIVGDRSFVFSGTSRPDPALHGFTRDEFDLTPFAGHQVRLAFHAWTGALGLALPGSWTIASATVSGSVLDAGQPRIRLHLATDASNLQGSFAVSDVSITGVTNSRDVGVSLTSQPQALRSNAVANVSGQVRNFGPGPREGLMLGISVTSLTSNEPIPLDLGTQVEAAAPAGLPYQHVIAFPTLDPAGSGRDAIPFSFNVLAGTEDVVVKLQVLENVGAGWVPVLDDIPARTTQTWTINVADTMSFAISSLATTPKFLSAPGAINATAIVRNDGTLPFEGMLSFSLAGATRTVPVVALAPGASRTIASGPLEASSVGDQRLTASLRPDPNDRNTILASEPAPVQASAIVRVGTNELVLSQSFESSQWPNESWVAPDFTITTDEAKFGNSSLLFGVSDTEYAEGKRIDTKVVSGGTMRIDGIELSKLLPSPELTYWEKARLGHGRLQVAASVTSPADCDFVTDPELGVAHQHELLLATTDPGYEGDWTHRVVPLSAILDPANVQCTTSDGAREVALEFILENPSEQGWHVDGVAIASSAPVVVASTRSANITDSVTKDYVFEVDHTGLVDRTFDIAVDAAASGLSSEQLGWIRVEPSVITLGPREHALAHVVVRTPPSIGSFRQTLRVVTNITPRDSPFERVTYPLSLDLDPKPRADLRISLLADGKPLVADAGIQERTPHEITAIVTNIGGERSAPTTVKFEAIAVADRTVVWNDTEVVDRAIEPSLGGDDVYVVSAHWTPPGELRAYMVHVVVDPAHLAIDFDHSNDDLTVPVNVTQLIRPDLDISPATATITTPDGHPIHEARPGDLVRVQAVARNTGNADAKDVVIRIVAGSSVLKELTIPSLAANASVLIATNHIVPATTVSYDLMAFTSDAEQSLSNNAVALTLPIFPADIAIAAPETISASPGEGSTYPLAVKDDGPYPLLLNFSVASGVALVDVGSTPLALRPGETREIALDIHAPTMAAAGRHPVVVEAVSSSGERSQRTLMLDVRPRVAFALHSGALTTDPRNVSLPLRVDNLGNVAAPVTLVVSSEGDVLGTMETATLQPGDQSQVTILLRLPNATRVGDMRVQIDATQGDALVATNTTTITLTEWSHVDAAPMLKAVSPGSSFDITLHASGTSGFIMMPRADALPRGVSVTFEPSVIKANPGDDLTVRANLSETADTPPGIYAARLRFVDPERAAQGDAGVIPVELDLRQENVTFLAVASPPSSLGGNGERVWRATLRNVGDRVTAGDRLDLYVDQVLVASDPIAPLGPGNQTVVAVTWNATNGKHGVALVIETARGHAAWQMRAEVADITGSELPFTATSAKHVPGGGAGLLATATLLASVITWGWRRRRD